VLVEDLQPFAIVQRAQRLHRDALQPPDVLFTTMRQRRILERDGQPLGARFVLARFGFESRAQRCREAAPAAAGQLGEVAFERVDPGVGLGGVGVFRRQRNALGPHDHAHRPRLAVWRARVFGHLGHFGSDQVSVSERANELEVKLREAQRQALARRPATGRGPDDKRIGSGVLAKASEAGFDRSSCEAWHVVRLAVEPHPCGQRRANLSR